MVENKTLHIGPPRGCLCLQWAPPLFGRQKPASLLTAVGTCPWLWCSRVGGILPQLSFPSTTLAAAHWSGARWFWEEVSKIHLLLKLLSFLTFYPHQWQILLSFSFRIEPPCAQREQNCSLSCWLIFILSGVTLAYSLLNSPMNYGSGFQTVGHNCCL